MTDFESTVWAAKKWLLAKNVTMWMNWNITQQDELHEAAVWLAETANGFVTDMSYGGMRLYKSERFDVV